MLAATAVLFSVMGCEEDSPGEVTPTMLVSVTVEPQFAVGFDRWMIIHDEAGEILEFKEFATDEPFEIITSKPVKGSTITMTTLYHLFGQYGHTFSIASYTNLEIGQAITMHGPGSGSAGAGAEIGIFTYTLSNFQGFSYGGLSNKFGSVSVGYTGGAGGNIFTCRLYANADKHIFHVSDEAGNLKYAILNNPVADGAYSINANELLNFDKTVQFTFPATNDIFTTQRGKEPGQSSGGYVLNRYTPWYDVTRTSLKLGYLNSLSGYDTKLWLTYPDKVNLTYTNIGTIPTGEVPWPAKTDFTVSNESLGSFLCSAVKPFNYRTSQWSFSTGVPGVSITWVVYSPSTAHKVSGLPQEILDRYPDLVLNELKYSRTTYHHGTQKYSDYISSTFKDGGAFSGEALTIEIIK